MTTAEGLTGADLLDRSRLRFVRRDPNDPTTPPQVDPVAQALQTKRALLADRILDAEVKETEAKVIGASTEHLRALLEQKKASEELKGGGEDGFKQWVLAQLESTQQRLAAAEQARQAEKAQDLNERLALLQNELAELRQARQSPERPLDQVRSYIALGEEVHALVAPPQPPAILTPDDKTLAVWQKKTELDHEARAWEREDRKAFEERRLAMEHELAREKLGIEQRHYDQMDRFINESGPRIVATITQMAERWVGGNNGASAPAAAGSTAQTAEAPAAPAGAQSSVCQCGAVLFYEEGWPGVYCSRCGTKYALVPVPEEGAQ